MGTPLEGLERIRVATASGDLDGVCERLGIGMLVVFGSAVDPDRSSLPRDLDIAVSLQAGAPGDVARAQMAALTHAVETAPMRRRDLELLADR